MGKLDIIANIYQLTNKVDRKLLNTEVENVIQETDNICIVCSVLPRLDGVVVRILGNKASDIDIACKRRHNFFS